MTKSLSDLRTTRPTARPERSVTLCLAPHLVGDIEALVDERMHLLDPTPEPRGDEDRAGPPRRVGQGKSPRAKEIETQLETLLAEVAENEGEMRLRANWDDGEWRRWVDAHPARDEDEPGHQYDQRAALGICNGEALVAELGAFMHEWNGDPMKPGDWDDIFAPVVGGGDKVNLAATVVGMYENRLDFPRWRSGWSATLSRLSGSASAPPSGSPSDDSTAGSPDSSTAATTGTDSA